MRASVGCECSEIWAFVNLYKFIRALYVKHSTLLHFGDGRRMAGGGSATGHNILQHDEIVQTKIIKAETKKQKKNIEESVVDVECAVLPTKIVHTHIHTHTTSVIKSSYSCMQMKKLRLTEHYIYFRREKGSTKRSTCVLVWVSVSESSVARTRRYTYISPLNFAVIKW